MKRFILVAFFILASTLSASEARTIRATACPGVGNTSTPYQITFIKKNNGDFKIDYFVNRRGYPLATLNVASMRSLNPDWSFIQGAFSFGASVFPVGRLLSIIRTGARGAETIGTIRSPRSQGGGHNGMTKSMMEICMVSAYRNLRGQEGVVLNLTSQSSLEWNLDLIRDVAF